MHIQTYSWIKYALCKSKLSGGLQAEAIAFRRSFSKHHTLSNLQLNKVWALWKYSECWASSRSNGFQTNFFETFYMFKHTIEQSMRSVKAHWVVGFKEKRWLSEVVFWNIIHIQTYNWKKCALCQSNLIGGLQAETMAFRRSFWKHYTHANIQLNKVSAMWKYTEWWSSSRKNGFQKIFFKTLYTFKHTIEQNRRPGKVQWVMGFNQKQWLSQIFSKQFRHSNIQLNKVCALWKSSEWWASSRSNGFQKFFKTIYIFKHTAERSMRSLKVQWVMGFNQKQWLAEEVFQNIIHIETCNWTKYELCESTLSGGLQAEAMAFRRKFSKHYTHSNIQLNKVCAVWKYSDTWASSRSNGFQKKFSKTLYTIKHTNEQNMRSVNVQWVVGFKQKQWVSGEVFQNIIHIQAYNWTKYALSQSTLSHWAVGFKQKQWLSE